MQDAVGIGHVQREAQQRDLRAALQDGGEEGGEISEADFRVDAGVGEDRLLELHRLDAVRILAVRGQRHGERFPILHALAVGAALPAERVEFLAGRGGIEVGLFQD